MTSYAKTLAVPGEGKPSWAEDFGRQYDSGGSGFDLLPKGGTITEQVTRYVIARELANELADVVSVNPVRWQELLQELATAPRDVARCAAPTGDPTRIAILMAIAGRVREICSDREVPHGCVRAL